MQKQKKIAIVINDLAGGGAEKVMLTLATTLQQLGHHPHFFVLQKRGQYQVPAELPCHDCFDKNAKNIDGVFKRSQSAKILKHKIEEVEVQVGKFDLYLSNLDKTNLLMTKTGLSPLYCIVHNSIEEELKRQIKLGPIAYFKMLIAKKSLNNQNLVCVSDGIAHEILNQGRIKPKQVKTIYNPFAIESIRAAAEEPNEQMPKGDFLIHVGRVAKQKRHDILFESLKMMKTNIPIVLLCSNAKKAVKLAKKHGVSERLIIPGFQPNPYAWIKRSKALVLSSDYEGLPTVLIESLICGTPAVSTDCPHGPNEILTNELSEYLVPVREPKILAEKTDALLQSNFQVKNAPIIEKVNAEAVAEEYLSLIKS
ncbi:glycosyltransferase [Shewanella sp. 202IG2-18]|uniref:glycosyltransferase n=1 Tax=Parashewanella hymeniacidonis TaxID=2807618 RepID=UPI0019607C94|nr:glycosyltransferase [Parashewanella hymeniacidonis]MBM7071093.1 glycosyltransferase [Parashewanella hymeniacidonis]